MEPFAQQTHLSISESQEMRDRPVCWAGAGQCQGEEVTLASGRRRLPIFLGLTGDMWDNPSVGRGLPRSQAQPASILTPGQGGATWMTVPLRP